MSGANRSSAVVPALVTASAAVPAALLFVLSAVLGIGGLPLAAATLTLVGAALGLIWLGQSMRERRALARG
ncbi:hypothetical protein ACFWY9_36460 [Amycolatopsis sp. NPDC059027]|uniref:hypothetical protein n=1 Tax=unclassified Amycolatopsis TaxID=2618356 RepID=UPI00367324D7